MRMTPEMVAQPDLTPNGFVTLKSNTIEASEFEIRDFSQEFRVQLERRRTGNGLSVPEITLILCDELDGALNNLTSPCPFKIGLGVYEKELDSAKTASIAVGKTINESTILKAVASFVNLNYNGRYKLSLEYGELPEIWAGLEVSFRV